MNPKSHRHLSRHRIFAALLAAVLAVSVTSNAGAQQSPSLDETMKFIVSKLNGHGLAYTVVSSTGGLSNKWTWSLKYRVAYDKVANALKVTISSQQLSSEYSLNGGRNGYIGPGNVMTIEANVPPSSKTPSDKRMLSQDYWELKHETQELNGFIQEGGLFVCGPFKFPASERVLAERVQKALKHWYSLSGVKDEPF